MPHGRYNGLTPVERLREKQLRRQVMKLSHLSEKPRSFRKTLIQKILKNC
ncbi:MAG: hypothetical protein ACTSVL_04185 [Promethearchaeota archaeon]